MALASGNIAFVGFNADGNDNIAFVALVDISAGETIIFEDNEWNGTTFNDTNEGAFSWTATSVVTAGTIVRIDNIGSGTIAASTGTVVDASLLSPSRGTNRGLGAGDETIYAYQGTAAAPTFITAIASGGFSATNGLLTNTGLTAGVNAINLSTLDDDADIAAFNAARSGQANFAAYLPIINNPTNWIAQDGTGDQSIDTTAPDVPFSSTVFTINAVATPTVTIAAQDASAAEAGSDTGTFRISRTGDTTNALTVNYAIATGSGQATNGTDYTPTLTGSATIAIGQAFVDISITPVDDAAVEGNETVTITLSSSANYSLGTDIATVNIIDNDTPLTDFTIGGFSFNVANIVSAGSVITSTSGTAGFLSGLLDGSGSPLANKTVGAILNVIGGSSANSSATLGEAPIVGGIVDNRAEIELTWGGSRLANDTGNDFVIYENGNTGFPEGYAVAVRRTSTGQFTNFLYQFSNNFDDSAVTSPVDGDGVFATAFDLSAFGLNAGESIDAIRVVNLTESAKVSGTDGQGFVDFTGATGFTPLVASGGSAFANTSLDPDITLVAALRNLQSTPTKISAIQGSGSTAALTGIQTIEGIVTRAFLGATKLNGFYVQEEDADSDGNVATSEAIFVYDPSGLFTGNVGDKVRITGTAGEFTSGTAGSRLTQLSSLTNVINLGASVLPTATNIQLPTTSVSDLERYEGMLVNISAATGNLTVTENFQLGRYGQIVLAVDGASNQAGTDARLDQYTQFNAPSVSGYTNYLAEIAKRKIYLDDGSGTQNVDPTLFGRGGQPLSATNTLRSGDTVSNIIGILDQRFEGYRIQTTDGVNFTPANPRPVTPPAVGGTLKVASFNVLNYFNDLDTNTVVTFANGLQFEPRGANTATEFTRQRDRTINAIIATVADVLGLTEIENNGYGSTSAIQDLVNGLNAIAGAGTYAFINPNSTNLGSDAISVAFIYKPSKVTTVGAAAFIPNGYGTGAFDVVGRKPLAQTFQQISTGEQFTAVINHFKSKGSSASGVGDADAGDGQGFSNGTRTRQAQDLASWLATKPTGTSDADYILLGDFNAYAQENPLTTLASSGYNNLSPNSSYSYVFDGQVGALDHALGNSTLASQVTGAIEWHINADEPSILDYNTEFKSAGQVISLYSADPFRTSDHDPVLVGLNLNSASTNIVLSANAINENVAANSAIATFTTTDPTIGDTFTYSFVTGTNDNSAFTISGNQLLINASPNFEAKSSYNILVRTTDQRGLSYDKALTININDVNEVPIVTTAIADLNAKQGDAFNFQIPTNTFTDIDAGDILTYSVTLENGNALPSWLTFNPTTRTFSGTPTSTDIGTLNVKVTASDLVNATASDRFVITIVNAVTGNNGLISGATAGDDVLIASSNSAFNGESNILFTGAGSDRIDFRPVSANPNSGNNRIDAGSGDDTIFVSQGDRAFGGDGNDTFDARDGKGGNRLSGGAGDDKFYLGFGDRALGGDGNDQFFISSGGNNLLSGGAGADIFNIITAGTIPSTANTILDFQAGTDSLGVLGKKFDGTSFSLADLTLTGNSIMIATNTIATLTGVNTSTLTAANFTFV